MRLDSSKVNMRRARCEGWFRRDLGVFAILTLAVVTMEVAQPAPAAAQKTRYISIGANPVGLPWYQMAAGFSEILNKNLPGYSVTVEATAGGVENARRLRQGSLELALQMPVIAYESYTGTGKFTGSTAFAKKDKYNILAMTAAQYGYAQIATTPDSGIKTVRDLKGKRVGLGPLGSANLHDSKLILGAHGINPDKDVTPFLISFPESVGSIKNGQLDAFLAIGALPQATILDLAASKGVVLVPLDEDALRRITEQVPFYFPSYIPANAYPGQSREIRTFSFRQLWIVREDLEEALVYQIVGLMYDNLGYLGGVHPGYKDMSVERAIMGLPIPLHPGAVRYYREKGVPGLDEFVEKMKSLSKQR